MAEAARGNMRPCGCHRGRPCTCEMGRGLSHVGYACGECINCELNAKAVRRHRKPVRKCVRHNAFVAEQQLDRLEIAPGYMLRMRKPDWDVHEKSEFYTRMRQLRLGYLALQVHSAITIGQQIALRKKYNRDLVKTQEALQRVEASRNSPAGTKPRRMATDVTHVDSDVFDSHSKQLIAAETLLPDLLVRLEAVNETIATEERNLQLVEAYVNDVAVKKLQATVRDYQRAQRWKQIWWRFREDVEWAAATVIQSLFRMARCRRLLPFLRQLRREEARQRAADRLRRFFSRLCLLRRLKDKQRHQEALDKARTQKHQAAAQLLLTAAKVFCRLAIWKWRERSREATAQDQRKALSAVVTIQRHWRGLRARLYYCRCRYRRLLSDPVRVLYDQFVCHGDLWRLLFEVDAAFRRHDQREREEQYDAKTFVSELVRDKRAYEDKMMQAWLTASALESPIVRGADSMVSAFALDNAVEVPEGFPLAHAILQSPIAKDLVALSPAKTKSDVFPHNLPDNVIRQATYEGFTIAETVAVMRGLIAQGKPPDDAKLVLKVLKSRAPLMTHAWKPERVVRRELRPSGEPLEAPLKHRSPITKRPKRKPTSTTTAQPLFMSDNMIDNVPGGLKGSVDRLLLVAGLRCFDPDAALCKGRGTFAFRLDSSSDHWRSYLDALSPLIKIRREQVVQDAIKQHIHKLKEKACFTAFDILHNVRGIDELVSWGIPRPLVMSIYDVIELLHHQTVNRSDRNIKRHMRVSAQFEAYVEQQKERSERHGELTSPPALTIEALSPSNADRNRALNEVAIAIERDVLELPLRAADIPIGEVLFKAHFLLCDSDAQNQQHHVELSQDSYKRFLSDIVAAQLAGDGDSVKRLVQTRMAMATRLALDCETQLAKLKVVSARDLKALLCERSGITLQEALRVALTELLTHIPDQESSKIRVGRLQSDIHRKGVQQKGQGLAPLSPLIRQSKGAVDTLDEALRGIQLPL